MSKYRPLKVSSVTAETDEISVYELVDMDGMELPAFTAGAHIEIAFTQDLVRHYSLCNDPGERHRYVIAVKLERQGRGGSLFMHERIGVGTILRNWKLGNSFDLDESGAHYILIAGGVGITPIMSMMKRLEALDRPYTLHYCAKSEDKAAFRASLLQGEHAGRVRFHYSRSRARNGDQHGGQDDATMRWNAADALSAADAGTQVYCCGPGSLISSVRQATTSWPAGTVHMEFFSAASSLSAQGAETFSVKIAKSGDVYPVPPDRTILQVLRQHGLHVESTCEAGACGTCQVRYLDGTPDHRDLYLTEAEQSEFIMVCVSRSKTPCLTLDL